MKKLTITFLALALCVVSMCAIIFSSNVVDAEEWGVVDIEEEYSLNSTFTAPSRSLILNSNEITATKSISFPDGSAYYEDVNGVLSVTLSQVGKYILTYTAKNDENIYLQEESFVVKQTAVTMGEQSSVSYGTGRYSTTNALKVTLARGEVFTFNKYFDMSKLTEDEEFMAFYVDPRISGAYDCQNLYFKFTDVLNPEETLTFRLYYQGEGGKGISYTAVAGNGQLFSGIELWNGQDKLHKGNVYGTPCFFSFDALNSRRVANHDGESDYSILKLYYGDASKQVYLNRSHVKEKIMVVDLDDPASFPEGVWNGFSSGKAYLSVYGDVWANSTVDVCFTSLSAYSADELKSGLVGTLEDDVPPELTVEASNLPDARLNYYYSIPKASAVDIYSGNCAVDVKVLHNGIETVEVQDGKFKASKTGNYTIVYTACDAYQNSTSMSYTIIVNENIPEIDIELPSSKVTEATCGDWVEVLSPTSITGGSGDISYTTKVKFGNNEQIITNGFYPENVGSYEVIYTATDYTGYSKTNSYIVEVASTNVPKLVTNIPFPRYLISGMNYTVGNYTANDYSSGSLVKKEVVFDVIDKNGTKSYNVGEVYTPVVSNNGDIVTINVKCNDTVLKSVQLPTILPYVSGKLVVGNYFINTSGSFTPATSQTGISFASNGNYSWTFAKPLAGNDFSCILSAVKDKANFKKITFTLTDIESDVSISMLFARDGSSYYFMLNGNRMEISTNFNNAEKQEFGYVNNQIYLGGNYVAISKDDNGNTFNGFPSGSIYFSMTVESTEATSVSIVNICEYPFTKASSDFIVPQVVISKEYGGFFELNSTYTIPTAVASDVLDLNVSLTLTVYDVNGNIMTAVDGTKLDKVSPYKEYQIRLTDYGQYKIFYDVSDSHNVSNFYYMVNVADNIAPIFTFESGFKTKAKVGDIYSIPKYTISDNLDTLENIISCVYVINPNGRIISIKNNAFKFANDGEYVFNLIAYDSTKNIRVVTVKVTVEA